MKPAMSSRVGRGFNKATVPAAVMVPRWSGAGLGVDRRSAAGVLRDLDALGGCHGRAQKWEIARIFVVGTGGSRFYAEVVASGMIGFFMAVAPYMKHGRAQVFARAQLDQSLISALTLLN